MQIERIGNNEIAITISSSINRFGRQRLIRHLRSLEATAKRKVKQSDIDKLADEVNTSWLAKNKHRFVK